MIEPQVLFSRYDFLTAPINGRNLKLGKSGRLPGPSVQDIRLIYPKDIIDSYLSDGVMDPRGVHLYGHNDLVPNTLG